MVFEEGINFIQDNLSIFKSIILVIVLIIIFNFINRRVKTKLLKKSKSKKQISNIKIFSRMMNVIFIIATITIAFFSYIGSWTGLGLAAGLITASLGFALQKPITGIAAWIMIIIKRPFQVGDRICIGDVRGEIYDITLSHIYIDEMGGTLDSSLHSGRNIMIPNYVLFEQNIINYTLTNDYVLEEVAFDVTYESNVNQATKIANKIAEKYLQPYLKEGKREISIRYKMESSSMKIKILFYAPIKEVYKISSNITKDLYDQIKKEKNIEIAYPHTEIIFKDKKLFKGKSL